MTTILNGDILSRELLNRMRSKVESFRDISGRTPSLCIFMAGNNPASEIYVNKKIQACKDININCNVIRVDNIENFYNPEDYLAFAIDRANNADDVDAIIVQLNLPKTINQKHILSLINPEKDVDVLTSDNMGLLAQGNPRFESCTPRGITRLLLEYKIEMHGSFIVIANSSNIVGKPLFHMFTSGGATVAMCHDKTPKDILYDLTKKADIIISATGIENFITKEMVSEKVTIVDVGIVRKGNKIVGDADYENLNGYVRAITPVPGGIGPMTVAMLLDNTILAACALKGIDPTMLNRQE